MSRSILEREADFWRVRVHCPLHGLGVYADPHGFVNLDAAFRDLLVQYSALSLGPACNPTVNGTVRHW